MKNDGAQTSREVQVPSSHTEQTHDQRMDQPMDDHPANMSHSMHDHTIDHDGHGAHVNHSEHEQMFRQRFWVCLLLTIPVLLFSPMIQTWFGFSMPEFTGSTLIGPAFAIAIFLYGGLPFLQMAVPEIQNRQPGMMLLISLAITVAFVYSLFALVAVPGSGFFWEMATLIDIMLLGHWMEMRSVRQASGALDELAKLMPDTAERIGADGSTETIPVSAYRVRIRCLQKHTEGNLPYTGPFMSDEVVLCSGLHCVICFPLFWICSLSAGRPNLNRTSRFCCCGSKSGSYNTKLANRNVSPV